MRNAGSQAPTLGPGISLRGSRIPGGVMIHVHTYTWEALSVTSEGTPTQGTDHCALGLGQIEFTLNSE